MEEVEKMWEVKATVVLTVVIRTLGAVNPGQEEWLQWILHYQT